MKTPAITQQTQLLQRLENNNHGCRLMAAVQTHSPIKTPASTHVDANKAPEKQKKKHNCILIGPQREPVSFQISPFPFPISLPLKTGVDVTAASPPLRGGFDPGPPVSNTPPPPPPSAIQVSIPPGFGDEDVTRKPQTKSICRVFSHSSTL